MIAFCIGFMVGGVFGMFLMALVTVGGMYDDSNEVSEEVRETTDGNGTAQ